MSTTNTTTKWYWYIRKRGEKWYLGLVDEDGDACDTANYNIDIWYDQFPDEITSDDDLLGIPEEFIFGLAKGVASELIKLNGMITPLTQQYDFEFERLVYDAIHKNIEATQQPLIQTPLNIMVND